MKCGARFVASWTGNVYVCAVQHVHLYHVGYCGEDQMEWPNAEKYCCQPYPNTHDMCKRPPGHRGYCRVKVFGRVIQFKIRRTK